jgi:hypothetical protein
MSVPDHTDPSALASQESDEPTVLLICASVLVPAGLGAMFVEMIGSSHNDHTIEWPWYLGSAALVVAGAMCVQRIVSVGPRASWWIIAYLLGIGAGCIGLWGLALPLLDRIG